MLKLPDFKTIARLLIKKYNDDFSPKYCKLFIVEEMILVKYRNNLSMDIVF